MASRDVTPSSLGQIDLTGTQSEPTPLEASSLPSAFDRLGKSRVGQNVTNRDHCFRPTPIYNDNYNPYKPLNLDKPTDYSLYVFGEPLFDDRPIDTSKLRSSYKIASTAKKTRTAWT